MLSLLGGVRNAICFDSGRSHWRNGEGSRVDHALAFATYRRSNLHTATIAAAGSIEAR